MDLHAAAPHSASGAEIRTRRYGVGWDGLGSGFQVGGPGCLSPPSSPAAAGRRCRPFLLTRHPLRRSRLRRCVGHRWSRSRPAPPTSRCAAGSSRPPPPSAGPSPRPLCGSGLLPVSAARSQPGVPRSHRRRPSQIRVSGLERAGSTRAGCNLAASAPDAPDQARWRQPLVGARGRPLRRRPGPCRVSCCDSDCHGHGRETVTGRPHRHCRVITMSITQIPPGAREAMMAALIMTLTRAS